MSQGAPIRVLVVDDSAFARKVLRELLALHADLEVVGTARDGLDALEKAAELRPDVMTLDLSMPDLDGLGVLLALREAPGPKIVVVSSAELDSAQGLAALEMGATELVHKPTALATDRLYELSADLVRAVRAAAAARSPSDLVEEAGPARPATGRAPSRRVIVVGASTGGPNAVSKLLRALPGDLPVPVVVVLHLPVGYTAPYAERLDRECALRVRESEDGALLEAGVALIARAGVHTKIWDRGGRLVVALDGAPADTPHRPSVDVLFASAAAAAGAATLGVVLTGMGEDGLAGSRALVSAGGEVLTETEASCVVYGMPRAVFEAGLAAAEASIGRMAAMILRRL